MKVKPRATGPTLPGPTLFDLEKTTESPAAKIERLYTLPGTGIHLGTSSFTSPGWAGSFYPTGMQNRDYLSYYATQFDTVEIDSTFYGTPVASTVSNWAQKTPADFVFAAKVPQTITHDKVLVNCEAEFDEFMERMNLLGAKLGPLVLQFPFFSRSVFRDANAFLARLRVFLKRAREMTKARLAVELRNRDWLNAALTEVLREYDASLALVDLSHMPRPWEMEKVECITSDFVYIRWLGDRKGIEALRPSWDKPVVDRTNDMRVWVSTVKQMVQERKVKHLFLFANNHYSGHAPSTVKMFWEIWKG